MVIHLVLQLVSGHADLFSVDHDDNGIECRREIIETLEQMGFEIEASSELLDTSLGTAEGVAVSGAPLSSAGAQAVAR